MSTLPTLKVEGAFGAVGASSLLELNDPTRGKLGTGTLGGALGGDVFVDISPYVLSISTRSGASRADGAVLRYDAGTCAFTLKNQDRRFDPTNLAGPYVSGGVTQIQPMKAVRFKARYNGIDYDMCRGFSDSWNISYTGPQYSQVELNCTDAFKIFSNYDRIAVAPVGANELSGARINRILDSIGWPSTDRDIAAGDTRLQATTLEGTALAELQLIADTEIGELYIDCGGRVVFRNRNAVMTDSRSNTSQATFGPSPGLSFEDVKLAYDDETLVNLAQIARTGGTTQTASDATSIATYLTHTQNRSDLLMQTDAEASSYASFLVYLGKDPELRFTEMVIYPQKDPANLWPQVLGRQIGDRITVQMNPPGGGSTISRDVFIRGIRNEIQAEQWKTTWTLQSATKYSFLVLNNPILGKLNSNALGY